LREYIESYEQLEVLLALYAEPSRALTAKSLGVRLRMPTSTVSEALAVLCNRNLVERQKPDEGAECFQLRPQPIVNQTLARLAALYSSHAVEIIRLMSAHSIERIRTAALRSFADAFLFRKDKNNG
jgi:DNA-binding MarR family transcriptional regulator